MNKRLFALLVLGSALAACSLAPEFVVPETKTPEAYKEEEIKSEAGRWAEAAALEKVDRGQWWLIFGDDRLSELEKQAAENNQSLKAAGARVEQARATVRANALSFLPNIDLGGNAVRAQPASAGQAAFGGNANARLNPYTLYSAQGQATYEVDLFGRVRDTEKAAGFDAEGEEALYKNVLLSLQADVAQNYFALRALDSERALLRDTVAVREEANRIMLRRSEAGEAGEQDLRRTESELATTKAELVLLDRRRAALEHALAVLLGKMPAEFSMEEIPLEGMPPQVPAGLPSSLLLRRPDIAAAQNAMAAANARIGIARTAFFPSLVLTASGGYESLALSDLFLWSSRSWALGQLAGAALNWQVFNSGRSLARLDVADAAYQEALANYRQQVLVAFREVEDNLSDQRLLAGQIELLDAAAVAAKRTTELAEMRYGHGAADYFEVVDAQRNSLASERGAVQLHGQRFLTAIALIRALGGGWQEPQPAEKQADPASIEPLVPAVETP